MIRTEVYQDGVLTQTDTYPDLATARATYDRMLRAIDANPKARHYRVLLTYPRTETERG